MEETSADSSLAQTKPPKGSMAKGAESSRFAEFPIKLLPTLPSLLSNPGIPLIHRDLSWLQFNERVLEQARPTSQNLPLERVKFLAISSSNLDEFFMIRMASLFRDILLHRNDPLRLEHLIRMRDVILENVAKFGARQAEILDLLSAELAAHGIHVVADPTESEQTLELAKRLFEEQILPQLPPPETFTPQKLAQIDNLQSAALLPDGLWLRVPTTLPLLVSGKRPGDESIYFFFTDSLISTLLARTFKTDPLPVIRITRDADVTTDMIVEGTEPTPDVVRRCLNSRQQGRPVRLQYIGSPTSEFLSQSLTTLNLISSQVVQSTAGTLSIHGLWSVLETVPKQAKQRAEQLRYAPLQSYMPGIFQRPESLFEKIRERDFLLHHPYDSFEAFMTWIRTACKDPKVQSVQLTVYRMGPLSPLLPVLKEAAKTKQVQVLIELRARFDESNNLANAEELSQAGVKVSFGFGRLKLHAKVALVTRLEEDGIRHYTHLSTGNYNAKTAQQYTDLALLTSNPEIGHDAQKFFEAVAKGEIPQGFKHLLLAPTNLHRRLLSLIEAEIRSAMRGEPARIVAKVNALVDESVIASLYRASQLGVKVELIVRGACSLIPGVNGLSSNIKVISIIDRFLEHSRLYYFEGSRTMYLSSADWMPRNFFRRLEIAFPILDSRLFRFVEQVIIPTYLADTVKARELTAQGTWKKRISKRDKPVRAQFVFTEFAAHGYQDTPLV